MESANHIYFLYSPDDKMFYYVENDLVKKQGRPTPLEYAPGGWQDISITNTRNLNYWGLDRSFSVPLDFYLTAGKIVKHVFYDYGTEARVLLIIMEQKLYLDDTTYGFYYDEFYKGELDCTQFLQSNEKTTVNIMEGGWPAFLKSNAQTTYQYKANESSMPRIYADGISLKQTATFLVQDDVLAKHTGGHTLALYLLAEETIGSLGVRSQERKETYNGQPTLWNTNEYFIGDNSETTELTITYDFRVRLELAAGIGPVNPTFLNFRLEVLDSPTTHVYDIYDEFPIHDTGLLYSGQWLHFVGTKSFLLPINSRVVAYMTTSQNAEFTVFTYDEGGSFTASYEFRKAQTFIKGFDLYDIFGRLVNSMTNGEYFVDSPLLRTPGFRRAITSVDCIRLFADALVKIKWTDFWSLVNENEDVGIYVLGKTVYLDLKENMIDWDDYTDLGELSEVKITPDQDFLFSAINIGSPNETYEDVNGLQEFNTTQEYKTPITKLNKTLDYTTQIRTDGYGFEFLRITLDSKPTTDSSSDDDLFFVSLETNTTTVVNENGVNEEMYKFDRILNPFATGLLTPTTVFNLKLSPKECLYRHENFIKSCMYWLDTKKITYQNQDKNSDLVVTVPGQRVIAESSDVQIGALNHRYFLPVMCEGTAPAPVNILQAIEFRPKMTVRFTIDGFQYKGLILKLGANPENNDAQVVQMLFGPDTDFSNLKNYFG